MQGAGRLYDLEEYFFSKKLKEIQALKQAGRDVINLGIGSPDLPPHPDVVAALSNSANLEGNHGYQPYNGTRALRSSIGKWMNKEYGVDVDIDSEVLPLLGSKEGILHVSLAFLNPGDKVAIPELGYPAYRAVSKMMGAEVIEYPLDQSYQPDWSRMSELGPVKLIWMNYPHMPTGAVAASETFDKALEFGQDHDVLICHDNPYSHVLNNQPSSILSTEGANQFAIELHSLSKSHNMAGWRVGWVVGNQDHISKILKVKSNIDSGMFRGVQDAAIAALNLDDAFHEHRNSTYRSRQSLAFRLLSTLNCEYDAKQSGMFVWGKLPGFSSKEFCDRLLQEHGIFITPGTIFGSRGKDYIRISLCCSDSILQSAINRVAG